MLFPTLKFAVFFLIVFFLYWYIFRQEKQRKLLLLIASYIFYASWNWRFCILLLAVSLVNYLFGFLLEREKDYKPRKALIVAITIIDILYLCFFKYLYTLLAYLSQFFPMLTQSEVILQIQSYSLLIPVGISYYTFRCMSYVFDIYLCKMRNSKSPVDMLLYVSFFPQLSLGPIVQAEYFMTQLPKAVSCDKDKTKKPIELDRAVLLIVSGLFKKMLIANFLTILVIDKVFSNPSFYNTWELLFGILSYTIVIYADFSGYSDMAIGLGLLLGFKTPKNFNRPYISKSISEFWRRWHISFSSWLRDYLYFALGGSRFGLARTIFALVFTMIIAGIWHGPRWTFVIWGAMQGLMLAIERIFYNKNKINRFEEIDTKALGAGTNTNKSELKEAESKKETKKKKNKQSLNNALRIFAVFIFVNISWLVFFSNSLSELGLYIRSFANINLPFQIISPFVIIVLFVGLLLQLPSENIRRKSFEIYTRVPLVFKALFTAVFIIFIYTISTSGIPPFIYFSF